MVKRLGIGLLTILFVFVFNIHPVDAATYIQGRVKFDDLAQTPDFYLTEGQKILSLTKQATKNTSFQIHLSKSTGEIVDTCIGDVYTFTTRGQCYFQVPSTGDYYLTFVNEDTTSIITMKYRLHDE